MASRLLAAPAAAGSSPLALARRITRRGLPGPEGPRRCYSGRWYPDKVNLWEDPWTPMRWKHSHFVVATCAGWSVFVYCGCNIFDAQMNKKNKKTEVSGAQPKTK